jgi:hypothetical protein
MAELYKLLEVMRYLKPWAIVYPPYTDSPIDTVLTGLIGLSSGATLLLEILPYVELCPGSSYTALDCAIILEPSS